MTARVAHCPNCNSTAYSPDPSNGGAGRNKCLACGQASPVAGWYEPRNVVFASGDPDPFKFEPGERRYFPLYNPDIPAEVTASAKLSLSRGYGNFDHTFVPERNVLHNSDNPDTANTTRKRNIADDAPPTHAPAPIRQYKDD